MDGAVAGVAVGTRSEFAARRASVVAVAAEGGFARRGRSWACRRSLRACGRRCRAWRRSCAGDRWRSRRAASLYGRGVNSRRGGRESLESSLRRKAGRSLLKEAGRSLSEAGLAAEAWLVAEGWALCRKRVWRRRGASLPGRRRVCDRRCAELSGLADGSASSSYVGGRLCGGEAVGFFFFPGFGEAGAIGSAGFAGEGAALARGGAVFCYCDLVWLQIRCRPCGAWG